MVQVQLLVSLTKLSGGNARILQRTQVSQRDYCRASVSFQQRQYLNRMKICSKIDNVSLHSKPDRTQDDKWFTCHLASKTLLGIKGPFQGDSTEVLLLVKFNISVS